MIWLCCKSKTSFTIWLCCKSNTGPQFICLKHQTVFIGIYASKVQPSNNKSGLPSAWCTLIKMTCLYILNQKPRIAQWLTWFCVVSLFVWQAFLDNWLWNACHFIGSHKTTSSPIHLYKPRCYFSHCYFSVLIMSFKGLFISFLRELVITSHQGKTYPTLS